MKNRELSTLAVGIKASGELQGVKLAYALAVNLKRIIEELDSLQKSIVTSEGMKAYDQARIELCKAYAILDENDEPVVDNGSFVIEDPALFNPALKELQESFTEAIEADKVARQEYNDLLDEESDIELVKVQMKYLPEDITANQMNNLMEMVEED